MRKRGKIMAAILSGALLFGAMAPLTSVFAVEADENSVLIAESDIPLRLQYDEEAPYGNETLDREYNRGDEANNKNDGWERWSIPLGNGYFGVNAFGRTETERLQITEKTLANPYYRNVTVNGVTKRASLGGLNNFSETYLDFGHINAEVTDYRRALDLKTAISTVEYTYGGVRYTREYFVSYPDRAIVLRLTSSEAGKLSFTLRPTIPYEQDYAVAEGDGASKHGTVVAKTEGGIGEIVLSGNMGYFDIDFEANYRVIPDGGSVSAANGTDEDGNTDNGTVTVEGAKSALIVITLGTNYELTSDVFTSAQKDKIPDTNRSAHDKVTEDMQKILTRTASMDIDAMYEDLKKVHTDDYSALFGRVTLDLGTDASEVGMMTDELLTAYKNGSAGTYLETLYFQYGRYLLIASSRENSLPPNLQGAWSRYNFSPWGAGYWHNINEQMNYWPAFTTNLAETFESYVNYNKAYMTQAKKNADTVIRNNFSDQYGLDGGNGWCLGNGFPYEIGGNDSAGNIGFMTELFWDYYLFTQDKTLLEETVYPMLADAARFITKIMIVDEDGHYLVKRCDSPEQYVNGEWYYTSGTTYAQTFAYTNNYHTLLAAKILGKTGADDSILNTIAEQLDKYDPIKIGYSGQLKEFREEDYYGDLGEWKHRHVSQLVGLYPAYIVNGTTEAWLDAAKYSLTERGYSGTTGWGLAHRLNLWARTGDGDQTYRVLQNLLKESTATNLWDLHPPFQIDGNFGGTAGIAEMLLQSQAGYIEPLAAIPDAWTTGSYTGLVARGNFEVGAKWENGSAQTFNILSKVGGECSVSYADIKNAKVRTASGKTVSFKATGSNLITFDTTAGETYIISSLGSKASAAAPGTVSAVRADFGVTALSWSAAAGAVSYNVYTAIEDAPSYTYVGSTEGTSFEVTAPSGKENARTTYRVTAVNVTGIESGGTLAYTNPFAAVSVGSATLLLLEDGKLQATIGASGEATSYRLYRKAAGDTVYTQIAESKYPVIVADAYLEGASYAVGAVDLYSGEETEKFEITEIQTRNYDTSGYSENLFLNMPITDITTPYGFAKTKAGVEYGIEHVNDGSFELGPTGRMALQSTSGNYVIFTMDLDGAKLLDTMTIYDHCDAGETVSRVSDLTVELYADGVWKTVAEGRPLDHPTDKTSWGMYSTVLELNGAKAERVRFTMKNTVTKSGISIYEITCSGMKLTDRVTAVENIFEGKTFVGDDSACITNSNGTYGYAKLTDGSMDLHQGRLAMKDTANSTMTAVMDLGGVYRLGKMKVYDFKNNTELTRANDNTVEVYYMGEWKTVIAHQTLLQDSQSHHGSHFTEFDLGNVKAEKVRLTFKNTTGNNLGVSVYEITCSGYKTTEKTDSNTLEGLKAGQITLENSDRKVFDKYPLTNAFDGNRDTRYALVDAEGAYTLTLTLPQTSPLFNLRIYDFRETTDKINGKTATRSDKTTVELLLADGKTWLTVIDKQPMTVEKAYTDFDLGGIIATKLRITFHHTLTFDNNTAPKQSASIFEMICTAGAKPLDRSDALAAIERFDRNMAGSTNSEWSAVASRVMKKAKAQLGEVNLSETELAHLTERLGKWNVAYESGNTYSFLMETTDGMPAFYEAKATEAESGAQMKDEILNLTDSATVTFLGNVTWDVRLTIDAQVDALKNKELRFDLNGMRLTLVSGAFDANNCVTLRMYSSRAGGEVVGSDASARFSSQGCTSPIYLGRYESDGEVISGDNLTVRNLSLAAPWSSLFLIDGGTYINSSKNPTFTPYSGTITVKNATLISTVENVPMIRYRHETTANIATFENCTVLTSGAILAESENDLDVKLALSSGAYYGVTLNTKAQTASEKKISYTVSDMPKFTAVESDTGLIAARVASRTYQTSDVSAPAVRYAALTQTAFASTVIWDYQNGTTTEELWLVGEIPENSDTRAVGETDDYVYRFRTSEKVKEGVSMTVAMRVVPKESKIIGNLSLYANITFNLYFRADGVIKGVRYNGNETLFSETVTLNGVEYYAFKIDDISPKDLSEAFTLNVLLNTGDVYCVNTSLSKYAASVLASTESAAGKNLVMALLDYVYEMSTSEEICGAENVKDKNSDGLKAIKKGLDYYTESLNYKREEWDGTAPTPEAGNITDASLKLASTPGFIFYLDSTKYGDATIKKVLVTINGVAKSYDVIHAEGNNHYIIVDDIHVSKYNDTMTVELDGVSFEYSLGAYMKGYGDNIPEYAKALYNYVCAAKAYLEAQGN